MAVNLGAEKAISEIKQLATTLAELKGIVTSLNKNVSSLQGSLNGMGNASAQLNQKFRNLSKSQKSHVTQVKNLKKVNLELSNAYKKQGLQLDKLRQKQKKVRSGMRGLLGSVKSLLAAFGLVQGAMIFANIIKNVFELIKTFDSLGFALEKIAKNTFDAGVSFRFMIGLARDFGVEIVSTTERWIKFLAAAKQSGLTLRDTQNIFKSMTKAAAVLGLKTDELRGIYLALEQMLSKGKVTTEELRRQLGERLPGAMGIMAASLGVTISQLDKMLKKGEVLSAEVLPNFAKAVEIAYGIESVEKVETLVAEQNRMLAAWQLFVKNVLSDSTLLKAVFSKIAESINKVTEVLSGQAFFENQVILNKKKLNKQALDFFGKEAEKDLGIDILAVRATFNSLNLLQQIEHDEKRKDLIVKQMGIQYELIKSFNERVELLRKDFALKTVAKLQEQYSNEFKANEAALEKLDKLKKARAALLLLPRLPREAVLKLTGIDAELNELSKIVSDYAILTAKLEDARGLVEKDTGKGKGVDDLTSKNLRAIVDLQKKIRANELRTQIQANKKLIAEEETSFTLKAELLERNLAKEIEINNLIVEDKIDAVNRKAEAEKGKEDISATRILLLEKERKQKIIILEQELSAKIIKIRTKTKEAIEGLASGEMARFEKEFTLIKENLENKKRLEIKLLNETATSSKELRLGMAEINQKYFDLENKALIKSVEKWIEYFGVLKLSTTQLEKLLDTLKSDSNRPTFGGDKEVAQLEDWLDLVREVFGAIGDLSQAFSDRRLENIEAEIIAEEDKYARLLELASDDAAQSESIQRERDAALAKLDKKKLKEEQNAAKVRKASALVQIGISTALAVMKNHEQFGFPIGSAFSILTIALGAIHAAAVLAAPIPQFAEGGEMTKDGLMMINDGGKQEYIERNGQILTTRTKNAIVKGLRGDTIHEDYDSMNKNSILLSAISNGTMLNQNTFDNLDSIIEQGLVNGFKKAKITNNLKVYQNQNDNYKNSLSRW